jgi:hypothetical protein
MKALFSLKSAIGPSKSIGIIALALLTPVIFPRLAFAAELQTSGKQNQIFEIKVTDPLVLDQSPKQNLSLKEAAEKDPLVISLKQYLEDNDSPLGEFASEMVKQPQWQRALAVSFVESHMGRDCYNNNCSGMGGAPGTPTWRKYATKLDWFIDLANLLEKPIYKEKYTTFKKMRGVYVQPGSDGWVYGATKKYNELMALTSQANLDRQALAKLHEQVVTALLTFAPEHTN